MFSPGAATPSHGPGTVNVDRCPFPLTEPTNKEN